MHDWHTEGWQVVLYNWQGTKLMKFQVKDFQAPGKRLQKEMDDVTSLFGQWLHYVGIYRFVDPDTPSAQFQIYKNGQLHNDRWSDAPSSPFSENMVDKLVFGWQIQTQNSPTGGNAVFDEVLIVDGVLTAKLVEELYEKYV